MLFKIKIISHSNIFYLKNENFVMFNNINITIFMIKIFKFYKYFFFGFSFLIINLIYNKKNLFCKISILKNKKLIKERKF